MVINVPVAQDYFYSGKELLNFSWDLVTRLLIELDQVEYFDVDQEEISDDYWESSKSSLTTALAVVQQGVEFILKGKIAHISPYLLITDAPSNWPSIADGAVVDFAAFRSIDAQDLIKVHDTFSSVQLNPEFVEKFNVLRMKRNQIIHAVNGSVKVQVADVFESLLYMHKQLFPEEHWLELRASYLASSTVAVISQGEQWSNQICWETDLVIHLLNPADVKQYFDLNTKQRKYFCSECLGNSYRHGDFEHKLAELRPKSPCSTTLYCTVCNVESPVTRDDCEDPDCLGNVISEDGQCLTCAK